MKSKAPLVSVLMTVYNREEYIAEAIESVLDSTYRHWELIIVDDLSTDNSLSIAKGYAQKDERIRVIRNEVNLGDYPNRNRAASYANGKYIKYLDSDDMLYPDGLEDMVSAMEKFPEAGIGLAYMGTKSDFDLPNLVGQKEAVMHHFYSEGLLYVGPTGAIYKRSFFEKQGGFGDYGVASDYAFNLFGILKTPIALYRKDLFWWRPHEKQEIHLKQQDYLRQNNRIIDDFAACQDDILEKNAKTRIVYDVKKEMARPVIKSVFALRWKAAFSNSRIVKLPLKYYCFALLPKRIRYAFYP